MEKNLDNLTKHLKALNLSIDKVEADGDCAFRSIVRQIHRKMDMFSEETRQYITSLGLCTGEEQDTRLLRHLFVNKITEKYPELQEFLADENENEISRLAEEFRQPGFWANDIGDFVMKACCIIIRIPITLVTSMEKNPYIKFSSRAKSNEEPLYLAFDSNHYDATITKGLSSVRKLNYWCTKKTNPGKLNQAKKQCGKPKDDNITKDFRKNAVFSGRNKASLKVTGDMLRSRGKRPKNSSSESSPNKLRKQERRDGSDANSQGVSDGSVSGEESMDVSYTDSTASSSSQDTSTDTSPNLGLLAENVVEVEVDFNEKVGKKGENLSKTGIPNVLKAELALRNTNGGIIKLKAGCQKKFDEWVLNLNDKRHEKFMILGEKEQLAEIIDYRPEELLIFVRKSSIILTGKSNLYERRGPQKYELQNFFEIQNMLEKKNKPQCCCTYGHSKLELYKLGQHMPDFGENVTVEYKKLTSKNLPDMLRKRLRDYIVAFANTSGGYVYFGVSNDGIIKGQKIRDEREVDAIHRKIDYCMNSKIWINKSGERETPICDTHYQVDFYPVIGAEQNTYVIVVHICRYAGTVFLKEPECTVINDQNHFDKMSFEKWLASFRMSSTCDASVMDYQKRFDKRIRGTSVYFSVKETVEKFVAELISPGQLKLHPEHAVKWIKHPALDRFVELLKKTLEEQRLGPRIVYIERSWEVNLGLPSTKPDDVICDVLLCGPQMPFVFVSITMSNSPTEASCSYNRMMATRLKATLVEKTFCQLKFYVKPIIISQAQLLEAGDVSLICSENPVYPETYRMNQGKYNNILEALVLVLARANVMATHVLGQSVFDLLTREQYKILHEFYEDSERVKITGPPGSGKTVLALERISRLRNGGCRDDEVLFLCSYNPLKARVGNHTMPHDRQPFCIVMTYYELARLIESDENFYHHLENVKHILADEVQNFEEEPSGTSLDWWYKLTELLDGKEGSSFWVFFDVSQKVNNKRSVSLRGFSQKKLKTVIRTTGEIHKFMVERKYMRVDQDVTLGHDFMGKSVEVLMPLLDMHIELDKHLICILTTLLHKLIVVDGYNRNRITVLFTSKAKKLHFQEIFSRESVGCLLRNGEQVSEEGVVFDTIRRYSGEENDIVVGFCPEFYPSGSQNNNALMVSLCSRAKLKLFLIIQDEKTASLFNLSKWESVRYEKKVCNFSF